MLRIRIANKEMGYDQGRERPEKGLRKTKEDHLMRFT
jgi:hypothetical protein